ncbi:MAG: glycosyltransferase family 2 protein [Cyanobacteriota bacterium]|nr:glycosyltransferase family 2 protein [Cyanobacteriota bacterium]
MPAPPAVPAPAASLEHDERLSMETRVSILCPFRNAAAFLPGLIASVRAQSHADWELLLIDDGSADLGARQAAVAAERDGRIRALRAPPRPAGSRGGPWWPRNHGLAHTTAPWVAFLDADDLWHPRKLERQLAWHAASGAALSVTGYGRFVDGDGPRLTDWRLPPARFDYATLRRVNVIPMLTLLLRRELLAEGFQPCPHEDYLRWLDLFRRQSGLRGHTVPELLAFYRLHGANLTAARWSMPLWTYRVYRCHGASRVGAATALVPWGLAQVGAAWRSRRQPLRPSLAEAIAADPPLPLPPSAGGAPIESLDQVNGPWA